MRARCIAAQSLALRLLLARLFALRDQRSEGAGDAQGWHRPRSVATAAATASAIDDNFPRH
jgi:hypothetical protein